MKLFNVDVELRRNIDYKDEVRIYKDLKKGEHKKCISIYYESDIQSDDCIFRLLPFLLLFNLSI